MILGNTAITGGAVTAVGGWGSESHGVRAWNISDVSGDGNLTVSGQARLAAVGGDATSSSTGRSHGILTQGDFVATGGAQVTAVAGKASFNSTGMEIQGSLTVGEAGDTTPTVVTATGDMAQTPWQEVNSRGVNCKGTATIDRGGVLVARGGDSKGDASNSINSFGAQLQEGLTLTDGLLVAYAGKAENASNGGSGSISQEAISGGSVSGGTKLAGGSDSRYVVYGAGTTWTADKVIDTDVRNLNAAYALSNRVIIDGGNSGAALTLPPASTLTLSGVNVLVAGDGETSCGLKASAALSVDGTGTLIALGGTASGGSDSSDDYFSSGVYAAAGLTQSAASSIIAIGGSNTVDSYAAKSCGLRSDSVFTQSAGSLTAVGGSAGEYISYGVFANTDASIKGSVTAVGGSSADWSYGFYTSNKFTANAGARVSAVGGASSVSSVGLYSDKEIMIAADAAVSAIGGYASYSSIGVNANADSDSADAVGTVSGTLSAAGGYANGSGTSAGVIVSVNYSETIVEKNFNVTANGRVSAVGGSSLGSGNSLGILVEKNDRAHVRLAAAGTLLSVGGYSGNNFSAGAYTKYGMTIGDGANAAYVSAVGGCATGDFKNCFGLHNINSSVELKSGARAAIVGGKAAQDSRGAYCGGDMPAASGSLLAAVGGSAGGSSVGLILDGSESADFSGIACAVGGSCGDGNNHSSIGLYAGGTTVGGSLSAVGATTGAMFDTGGAYNYPVTGGLSAVGGTDGINTTGSISLSGSGALHALGGTGSGASAVAVEIMGTASRLTLSGGTKALNGTLSLAASDLSDPATMAVAKAGSEATGSGTLYKYPDYTGTVRYIASGAGEDIPVYDSDPNYYRLSFDTNGGSELGSITLEEYTTIDLSAYKPVRKGFAFTGWYDDAALTNEISRLILKKDATVYAGWKWINSFADVRAGDWFCGDVEYACGNGLFEGTGETSFAPHMPMTRAMLVTVLWRMEGEPVVNYAMAFGDVPDGEYYTEAVRWAAGEKLADGYDAAHFGPNDGITREQMVTLLYRFAKWKGYDVSVGENTNILSYSDAFDISEWAVPAFQWACGAEIIQGDSGRLTPQGSAERCQVAAILHRFCENVK